MMLVGLGGALAHNWLRSPVPFAGENKASTRIPCAAKTASYTPTTVPTGTTVLPMTWSVNHNNPHFGRIVKFDDALTTEAERLAKALAEIEEQPKAFEVENKVPGADLDITGGDGTYLVQYGWNNYRNCVQLVVGGGAAPGSTGTENPTPAPGAPAVTNAPVRGTYAVDCASYCTDFQMYCTKDIIPNDFFPDKVACMSACVTYPNLNTPNETYAGNSLQCRAHHLHVEDRSPEHCKHASQQGGGICEGQLPFLQGASIDVTINNMTSAKAVALEFEKLMGDLVDTNAFTVHYVEDGTNGVTVLVTFNDEVEGFESATSLQALQDENLTGKLQALEGVESAGLSVDKSVNMIGSSASALAVSVSAVLAAAFAL